MKKYISTFIFGFLSAFLLLIFIFWIIERQSSVVVSEVQSYAEKTKNRNMVLFAFEFFPKEKDKKLTPVFIIFDSAGKLIKNISLSQKIKSSNHLYVLIDQEKGKFYLYDVVSKTGIAWNDDHRMVEKIRSDFDPVSFKGTKNEFKRISGGGELRVYNN